MRIDGYNKPNKRRSGVHYTYKNVTGGYTTIEDVPGCCAGCVGLPGATMVLAVLAFVWRLKRR